MKKGIGLCAGGILCMLSLSASPAQEMPRWATQGASVEASSIDAGQQAFLAAWLDRNGRPPLEYAVDICREHQVVIFGESHGKREPLEFLHRLIPEAYDEAGMCCVVLEVAKHEDNDRLDRLVERTTFDRALALDIARNSAWGNWYYQEYWDVLEVVWKLNRGLPVGAEPVFTDVIEKVMALRANQPVGWNVFASPFDGIRDRKSYFFHFQPRVTFGDICRGYIFLCPCGKISACRPIKDFITEDMFKKSREFFEAPFNRTFNNVGELNEFMEKFGREI